MSIVTYSRPVFPNFLVKEISNRSQCDGKHVSIYLVDNYLAYKTLQVLYNTEKFSTFFEAEGRTVK